MGNGKQNGGFFNDYPEFFKTSQTSAQPNRLNHRVSVLIEKNVDIIKGKNILDIASHDGRFSFAAIKYGANHVMGIEGRSQLVNSAISLMEKYHIPKEKYTFIANDIHKEITKIKPNTIDTVFCFGFFYHTIHQHDLLSEIKRLNSRHLIIDSNVYQSDLPLMKVRVEMGKDEGSAVHFKDNRKNGTLVATPSQSAIEIMLKTFGFRYKKYDWINEKITNTEFLGDYLGGRRVTILAENID